MATKIKTPREEGFNPNTSPSKTYSLVELVKAPTTMNDHGPDNTVFSFPIVAVTELLLAITIVALLIGFSLLVNAPLEEIANPNTTTDPAKAPWYLVGLQELLEHGHPTLMAVGMPTLMVVFMMLIPYVDNDRQGAGVWFTSKRGKKITLYTSLYVLIVFPLYIFLDTTFPLREILRGTVPDWITQWVIPAIFMGTIVILPVLALIRIKPTMREFVMTLFTVLFVGAIVFTLSGFLFRGPGFELYWPWGMPNGYNPLENL